MRGHCRGCSLGQVLSLSLLNALFSAPIVDVLLLLDVRVQGLLCCTTAVGLESKSISNLQDASAGFDLFEYPQGVDGWDVDLPTILEANWITNIISKTLWVSAYILVYGVRPVLVRPKSMGALPSPCWSPCCARVGAASACVLLPCPHSCPEQNSWAVKPGIVQVSHEKRFA